MATAMWAGFTLTPRGLCSVFFAVFVESGSVMCMDGIAGIFSPCAVLPSLVVRPQMLVIMAGVDRRTVTRRDAAQRDTQSSSCRPKKASIVFYVRGGLVYKWYFLGHGLVVVNVQNTAEVPQLQLDVVVDVPVVGRASFSVAGLEVTVEIPQFLLVVRVLRAFCTRCSHLECGHCDIVSRPGMWQSLVWCIWRLTSTVFGFFWR